MVMAPKTKPKEEIDPLSADNFANKANGDIDGNPLNAVNVKKRGNPRVRKTITRSVSLSLELDARIDEIISFAKKNGIFGVTRSDVIAAALSTNRMQTDKVLSELKKLLQKK